MFSDRGFMDAELIDDPAVIANLRMRIASDGVPLFCHGCWKGEAIAGVVSVPSAEEAYLLCGDCWGDFCEDAAPLARC